MMIMDRAIVDNYYKALGVCLRSNKKPSMPDNPDELLRIISQHPNDCGLEYFVTGAFILLNTYKLRLAASRAKNLRLHKKNKVDVQALTRHNPKSAAVEIVNDDEDDDNNKTTKISRLDCVSNQFAECNSTPIKIALALFLTFNFNNFKISNLLRREFITALMYDENIEKVNVIEMCSSSDANNVIRAYIKKTRTNIMNADNMSTRTINNPNEKWVLCGLIMLSELLNDKSCSKLGMDINPSRYLKFVYQYLQQGYVSSITPFEPVINKYIHETIPLRSKITERAKILNQFKMNAHDTIEKLILSLSSTLSTNNKQPGSRLNSINGNGHNNHNSNANVEKFSYNEMYECYKGAPGYTSHIVVTFHKSGKDIYKILTYNDCLFDVLGKITTNNDGGEHTTTSLYEHMPWSKRLALLEDEYRTKIALCTLKGSELNNYNDSVSVDITVSWQDENKRMCLTTYQFKKPKISSTSSSSLPSSKKNKRKIDTTSPSSKKHKLEIDH